DLLGDVRERVRADLAAVAAVERVRERRVEVLRRERPAAEARGARVEAAEPALPVAPDGDLGLIAADDRRVAAGAVALHAREGVLERGRLRVVDGVVDEADAGQRELLAL